MAQDIVWYFDVISPFAYLQHQQVAALARDRPIRYQPVLLAALLDHWGQKGPAEIPAKRTFTYRYVQWFAEEAGIPFRCPPAHPFNPLRGLRLLTALDSTPEATAEVFNFIWRDGGDLTDDAAFQALGRRLGVDDALALVAQPRVKQRLIDTTREAMEAGIFGVPTLRIDEALFFGNDATPMARAYLADPGLLDTPEMQRLANLPEGATRF